MIDTINGLVLAGGRSLRMATEKGLIAYHSKPQREYVFDLLARVCNRVFTSCKSADQIPERLHPLPDAFEFNSPLNGILSAFQADSSCAWLSVPVDMPLVDREVIEFLVVNRDRTKLATCFWDTTGALPEPLLTVWEKESKPFLENFFKMGGYSPRNFLSDHPVNIVEVPHPKYLININTDAEREAFLKSYMKNG